MALLLRRANVSAHADGGGSKWLSLNDGRRILFHDGGRLFLLDLESGVTREVLPIRGELLSTPSLAADDSQLFFLRRVQAGDIWLKRFENPN